MFQVAGKWIAGIIACLFLLWLFSVAVLWYNENGRQSDWAERYCPIDPGRGFDRCFAVNFPLGSSYQNAQKFLLESGFSEAGAPGLNGGVCRRFIWRSGDLSARDKSFKVCHSSLRIIAIDLPGENLDKK